MLSGALKHICRECLNEVPEYALWDVNEIEEEHRDYTVKVPDLDGDDWIVVNRYDKYDGPDEYIRYSLGEDPNKDSWGHVYESWDELCNENCIEIFVHDASDSDAIREARKYARNHF